MRGTGNSSGFSTDEYTAAETQDGADAIAHLAQEPWCSGKLGMLGTSYSGFNTLQVAALAPPQLKAIAPAYFTDRRYTDDCHYKGGCLRGYYDMLTYGLSMVAMNALPPFPAAVGNHWSDLWRQRLEQSEPYLLKWLAHQTEDDYWSVGSIAGHYHKNQSGRPAYRRLARRLSQSPPKGFHPSAKPEEAADGALVPHLPRPKPLRPSHPYLL